MEQHYLNTILKCTEDEHDIKIICSVECGSRAYKLNSYSSDYDIRYIYIQNDQDVYEKGYLDQDARRRRLNGELDKIADVKNRTFTDKYLIDGKRIIIPTGVDKKDYHYYCRNKNPVVVDLHGWDFTFAVKNLHKLNPFIVEWMFSPIVYWDWNDPKYNFLQRARQLLINQNRFTGLITHYIGMGKKFLKKYIENNDEVRVKKYMHCVRCCVMVKWLQINNLEQFQPLIQVDFNQVLEDLEPFMSNRLFNSVQRLVAKKRESDKDTTGPRYRVLDQFIERILNLNVSVDCDEVEPKMSAYNRLLDSCFLKNFDNINFD